MPVEKSSSQKLKGFFLQLVRKSFDELGIGDSDPFSPNGTNFNLTVDAAVRDPVSGTPSHRSNLCEVRLVERS